MEPGSAARLVAACMGLSAFAIALIAGVSVNNPFETTILRALAAMLVCTPLGLMIGLTAEFAVRDRLATLRAARTQSRTPDQATPAPAGGEGKPPLAGVSAAAGPGAAGPSVARP